MDKKVFLKIRGLDLSYKLKDQEKKIFENFNLNIYQGENLVILGESGSGKSTLANVLMGILPVNSKIDGGILEIDGRQIDLAQTYSTKDLGPGLGFSLIFQDASLALNPSRTIYHHFQSLIKLKDLNLQLSPYNYAWEILKKVGFDDPDQVLKAKPPSLSGGMCQRVCIGLSLAMESRLIIGDEPTSALDVVSSNNVIKTLKSLEDQTTFIITHDLDVAQALADRIVVLKDGQIIEENDENIIENPKKPYTKSLVGSYLALKSSPQDRDQGEDKDILKITGLTKSYGDHKVLDDLDLEVHENEILGILGKSGCGKSTLARIIMGLDQAQEGQIIFQDQDLAHLSKRQRKGLAPDLQMIFQQARANLNPYQSCIRSVQEVAINSKELSKEERQSRSLDYLARVGIGPDLASKRPGNLSTGQCQRVAIARAILTHPKLLVCDEIVSSLDQNIQADILDLILDFKEKLDMTVIFISHDISVLRGICDRIATMDQGQIVSIDRPKEIFQAEIPAVQELIQASRLA